MAGSSRGYPARVADQMSEDDGDLREVLKLAAVALKRAGVEFALGGGYAAWARGAPEPTHDVDFVVSEHDAARAAEALREAGLDVVQPPEDWLFKAYHNGAMVDVVHRLNGRTVDSAVLASADEQEVCSVRMPVLAMTDVMASKLNALNEKACDFSRLLPVARAVREQVDWGAVRERTAGNDYAFAFLVLVERLGIAPPGDAPGGATGDPTSSAS